jgi:hypothetical protein
MTSSGCGTGPASPPTHPRPTALGEGIAHPRLQALVGIGAPSAVLPLLVSARVHRSESPASLHRRSRPGDRPPAQRRRSRPMAAGPDAVGSWRWPESPTSPRPELSPALSDLGRLGNRETPAVLSVLVLEDFAIYSPPRWPSSRRAARGCRRFWEAAGVVRTRRPGCVTLVGSSRSRLLSHPDAEQPLPRARATLTLAALAEAVHVSAAGGAFLVADAHQRDRRSGTRAEPPRPLPRCSS